MPPKSRFSKEEILSAALELVRQEGEEGLNARGLAARLSCSTQPIFSVFGGMEALRAEVLTAAEEYFRQFSAAVISENDLPYRGLGTAYIRFATQEPELFRLLFLRRRSPEEQREESRMFEDAVAILAEQWQISVERARMLHMEMWTVVHGIATMRFTGYLNLKEEEIQTMLSDVLRSLLQGKGEHHDTN